jgi:DNA-binding MarR family transcriptional regulator
VTRYEVERPDDSPGFLLWHVTLRWQRAIAAALTPFELTHVQFVLLASVWWLNDHGEQPSQVRLAAHSGVDVKMLSDVARALERKDLVVRAVDAGDSRARKLTVTAAGRKLAPQAIAAVEGVDRDFVAPLSSTALRAFTRALRTLRSQDDRDRA